MAKYGEDNMRKITVFFIVLIALSFLITAETFGDITPIEANLTKIIPVDSKVISDEIYIKELSSTKTVLVDKLISYNFTHKNGTIEVKYNISKVPENITTDLGITEVFYKEKTFNDSNADFKCYSKTNVCIDMRDSDGDDKLTEYESGCHITDPITCTGHNADKLKAELKIRGII